MKVGYTLFYEENAYICDTSVIDGCCDTEFRQWSMALLSDFKLGIYSMILSDLIDAEIQDAPDEVKYIYEEFVDAVQDVYHFDLYLILYLMIYLVLYLQMPMKIRSEVVEQNYYLMIQENSLDKKNAKGNKFIL